MSGRIRMLKKIRRKMPLPSSPLSLLSLSPFSPSLFSLLSLSSNHFSYLFTCYVQRCILSFLIPPVWMNGWLGWGRRGAGGRGGRRPVTHHPCLRSTVSHSPSFSRYFSLLLSLITFLFFFSLSLSRYFSLLLSLSLLFSSSSLSLSLVTFLFFSLSHYFSPLSHYLFLSFVKQ